jgi:formate hydrogenlyase transcriptional activator
MTTMIAEGETTFPPPPFWQETPDPDQTEPPITEDGIEIEIGEKRDRPGFQCQSNCFGVEIIGRSPALRAVLKDVQIVARTNATVLILGETGTGKELIARALHNLSPRRLHALSKINCAAIPAGLLESELFGHERGAFTGAVTRKAGRVELAHQGTLFLDEVGDIPLELQPKLLRVLQEKEFERLGGTHTHKINVRVVAATSRDLAQMVADRQFRNDLYYRLNVFPIRLPALRERLEDIPLLVQHFVNKCARQMNKRIETIPPHIIDHLSNYHWPGNIRELQNVIERAVILSPGKNLHAPSAGLEQSRHSAVSPAPNGTSASGPATLEDCEREHILRALNGNRWVVGGPNGAAALLGLKRTTLISKMQKLGIARRAKPNRQIEQRNLL